MTEQIKTFADLVDLWPTQQSLADDVTTDESRVLANTVALWKRRDFIHPKYWIAIVRAAAARGIHGVTCERLAKIAESYR